MNTLKIAAYITVYNDHEAALKCIQAIRQQSYIVKSIFIVDNSPETLFLNNEQDLIINHYPNNIGIGQGLLLAIKWATEHNYDFLWTFDQDSIPQTDCLEILLDYYQKNYNSDYLIGIIAGNPVDLRNKQPVLGAVFLQDHFTGYQPENFDIPYECDSPITSGSLLSLKAAKTIDYPRGDLFIDGIDMDYGLRLKKQGFHNIIVPQAIFYHNFGDPQVVKFLWHKFTFYKYSALRHYYIARNHTYLSILHAEKIAKFTAFFKRIKHLIYTIIKILLYDDNEKHTKIWYCLLGTYHGIIAKMGKISE